MRQYLQPESPVTHCDEEECEIATCDECGGDFVVSFSRGLCYCESCDAKRDAYERKVSLMHELIRTIGVK